MTKEEILGLIRHILTFVGGILLMKGLVDSASVQELIGAVMALVGGIWSVLSKR